LPFSTLSREVLMRFSSWGLPCNARTKNIHTTNVPNFGSLSKFGEAWFRKAF
jgi:hypothetical protein